MSKLVGKLFFIGCEAKLTKWTNMTIEFQDSLAILDTINSTNPVVIDFVAGLKSFFTSKITILNQEIKYFFNFTNILYHSIKII